MDINTSTATIVSPGRVTTEPRSPLKTRIPAPKPTTPTKLGNPSTRNFLPLTGLTLLLQQRLDEFLKARENSVEEPEPQTHPTRLKQELKDARQKCTSCAQRAIAKAEIFDTVLAINGGYKSRIGEKCIETFNSRRKTDKRSSLANS